MSDMPSHPITELWLAYPIPVGLMFVAATGLDPLLGLFFSAHGGLGWLLLLLAFPWVLVRAGVVAFRGSTQTRTLRIKRGLYVLLAYVPVSVIASYFFVARLNPPLTLTMANTMPHHYFPFSILLSGW